MSQLKRCPFCGGEARYHIHDRFGIECIECGAGYAAVFPTKADVERAWNARAERTCHDTWDVELTGRLRFACSECGGVSLEIAARYCPICGAKVVDA